MGRCWIDDIWKASWSTIYLPVSNAIYLLLYVLRWALGIERHYGLSKALIIGGIRVIYIGKSLDSL